MLGTRPALIAAVSVAIITLAPSTAPAAQAPTVSSTPRKATTFNGTVRAIAVVGGTIYLGGNFTRAHDASGSVVRQHVAAVDAETGQLRRWNPGADGPVSALAATRRRVYLGGEFEHAAGSERRHLAAVFSKRAAGTVPGWRNDAANGFVKALAVTPRGLFVGGSFTLLSGRPRARLGLIRPNGRLAAAWRPRANDTVLALEPYGRRLYVGGVFSSLNRRHSAERLAAVKSRNGRLVRRFDPHMTIEVRGIDATGRRVYAAAAGPGGRLRVFGVRGQSRYAVVTDGDLTDVEVIGRTAYIGGHFDRVCATRQLDTNGNCRDGARERRKLAAISRHGRLRAWSPNVDSVVGVLALDSAAGQLLAGGSWRSFRHKTTVRPNFAIFSG